MTDTSLDETYARFEARFRGSRDAILERLRVYEPLLELVSSATDGTPRAVDCGCGRGEWLELLQSAGWDAQGIDTNLAMLSEASARGLRVENGDALAYLASLPSASVDLVSAFHVVEHLPGAAAITLVREALRVLSAHGVLIVETPNPENLLVSSANFYLDPTHERPIPPTLLQFFAQDAGASIAEIVRLNGETASRSEVGSVEAAFRPMFTLGLDYAVLATLSVDPAFQAAVRTFAQRSTQGEPVDLAKLAEVDASAARRIGGLRTTLGEQARAIAELDLRTTAARVEANAGNDALLAGLGQFRAAMDDRHAHAEANERRMLDEMRALTARVADLAARHGIDEELEDANDRLSKMAREASEREAAAEAELVGLRDALQRTSDALADETARRVQLVEQLSALHASSSWRVTKPMRTIGTLARWVAGRRRRPMAVSPLAQGGATAQARSPTGTLLIDPHPEAVLAWESLYLGRSAGRKS